MSDELAADLKSKKDRSPSFPFIPLSKAVDRAEALNAAHRREPARLSVIGTTWGYGPKSSGLLQTVAALKQFGLVEDLGSGEDRKVMLTDLARRIILDTRPGAREQAIQEAARRPRLIAEYLNRWVPERPSDSHCISELHLDRGFTAEAARQFLRVFDETVSYAHLADADADETPSVEPQTSDLGQIEPRTRQVHHLQAAASVPALPEFDEPAPSVPFAQRIKVTVAADQIAVAAIVRSPSEVDRLIRILQANKDLLEEPTAAED